MTTDVDIVPRRRGRLRAAVRIAIVLGIAALAFILYRAWAGDSADMSPDKLRSSLAAQVSSTLEQATPDEHAKHGHGEVSGGTKVLCAVDVLGFEPADATRPNQVRKVYANHQCAVSDNGRPWEYAVKTSGPLVATLGQPPVVTVVLQGEGFDERVRGAIPAPYQEKALRSAMDERLVAGLKARFDKSVADFWADFKASKSPGGA
jgi:hypothetical protein